MRLWIIGSSVRALAQSLRDETVELVATDQFHDLDLRPLAQLLPLEEYPAHFAHVVNSVDAAGCVFTGGLENAHGTLADIERRVPILGCDSQTVRRVRDVRRLQAFLVDHGFYVPETQWDQPDSSAMEPTSYSQWLLKSPTSSGGLGVSRWTATERTVNQISNSYWQRELRGDVLGVVFIGNGHRATFLGASRHLYWPDAPAERPFSYAGSVGPYPLTAHQESTLRKLGDELATEYNLRGWFGVDAILNDDGLWVLEVNPRYTASVEVLERAGDFRSGPWHLAACLEGELLTPKLSSTTNIVAKGILYADQRLRTDNAVSSLLLHRALTQRDIADIPADLGTVEVGQPILSVFASGVSIANATENLVATMREIQRDYLAPLGLVST